MKDFTQTRLRHIKRLYDDFKDQCFQYIKLPKDLPSDKCDKLPIVILGRHPPLQGGQYVCIITFPPNYPLVPPSIEFCTPNGKFNINTQICIAGLTQQHIEQWSPATSLTNLLIGLESTLYDSHLGFGIGFLNKPHDEQTKLAKQSAAYNKKHLKRYMDLFDDLSVKPDEGKAAPKPTSVKGKGAASQRKRKQDSVPEAEVAALPKRHHVQSDQTGGNPNQVIDLSDETTAHATGSTAARRCPRQEVAAAGPLLADDLEIVDVKLDRVAHSAGQSSDEPICL